jgi:hypothetical protein
MRELGELNVELDFDLRRWRLNLRPLLENHLDDFETLSVAIREVKSKNIYIFTKHLQDVYWHARVYIDRTKQTAHLF